MGNHVSAPIGATVLAYNNTGVTKYFGDQVTGDLLYASYVPGSYPYGLGSTSLSFEPTQLFECRGYSPVRTTTLWVRVA